MLMTQPWTSNSTVVLLDQTRTSILGMTFDVMIDFRHKLTVGFACKLRLLFKLDYHNWLENNINPELIQEFKAKYWDSKK